MAGAAGLEPVTSAVTGQRSNQLSYAPTWGHKRYANGSFTSTLRIPKQDRFLQGRSDKLRFGEGAHGHFSNGQQRGAG